MGGWPQLVGSRTIHSGQPSGVVIRCGLMDTMLADLPVPVVFFFERALDEDRIAAGLARALARVPAFGGRLRTDGDGLRIVCDDAGVPMTSYDVDETLGEAIGRVTLPGAGYVDQIDATAARAGGQALLTIRTSRLSDGAMVLGCSWHHAVGDMQSFMLLMRAWSAEVEGTEPPDAVLVTDREAYLDDALPPEDCGRPGFRLPEPAESEELAREVAMAGRANRTVQVYFCDEEIARMRAKFTATAGRRLSTNDVVCAHVVSAIRQVDDDHEQRDLALPVNVRRLLDLPDGLVGNLIGDIFLTVPAGEAPEALAVRIREAVEDFPRSHLNLRTNQTFLATLGRSRLRDCVPSGFDPAHRTFSVSNWSRFGLYDVTLDGQRPVVFSPVASLQLPWVSWLVEGFGNSGLLLTVALPTRLAGRLRGEAGRAALHRFREPGDTLPPLADAVRKLL